MIYKSFGRTCFNIINYIILILASLTCVLPFIHVLALSFSSNVAVSAGKVGLWPVDFNLNSYRFAIENGRFFRAMGIALVRTIVGTAVNMVMMILTAYPLAKSSDKLFGRNVYMGYFVVTMLISGGLIPTYIVVARAGLLDSLWALILPGALPVYNMVILMNFIRGIPGELEEAAFIDGAGPVQALIRVMLPVLKPGLATVGLFCIVSHWNSWFDGSIYIQMSRNYPLQTYLHTLLKSFEELMREAQGDMEEVVRMMDVRTGRAAQLFMGAIPLMLIYPFLQKYFTKGLVLGSVKG